MSKQTLRFVALILFCFAIPLLAQEAPPGQGSGSTTSGPGCNGGQCAAMVDGHMVVLSCPTSGGPVCADDQCICSCRVLSDGTVYAVNICLIPPPSPEEGPK